MTVTRHPSRSYDRTTVVLHWAVAFGVLFQWAGAHLIDDFAPGPMRVDARSVHILVGLLLTVAIAARMWWRVKGGVRLAQDRRRSLAIAARATHVTLYLLLTAAVSLGLFNTWLRGDSVVGLFHIPRFGHYAPAARHALANRIVAWHRLAANLILVVASVHAGAALAHHVWLGDDVLARMVPGLRRRRSSQPQGARLD